MTEYVYDPITNIMKWMYSGTNIFYKILFIISLPIYVILLLITGIYWIIILTISSIFEGNDDKKKSSVKYVSPS